MFGKDYNASTFYQLAASPGHSQIFLTAMEKNWEKAWDHYYVTDWKWWTRLVQTPPFPVHDVMTVNSAL